MQDSWINLRRIYDDSHDKDYYAFGVAICAVKMRSPASPATVAKYGRMSQASAVVASSFMLT
jgi:hypothetical protein